MRAFVRPAKPWRRALGAAVALFTALVALAPDRASAERRTGRRVASGRRPSSVESQPVVPRFSQYLRQAPTGRLELTPSLALYHSSLSRPTGSRETRFGHPLGAGIEYGFTPLFSLAFHLVWDSSSASKCAAGGACVSATSSGFYDPSVDLKFHSRLPVGVIAYGATVSYAVEKYRVQSSGDDNNATGGSAIAAFVGYESPLGDGVGGVKITGDLYRGDRQAESAGTPYTVSGGSTLSLAAFYEMPVAGTLYGGALSFLAVSKRGGYRADTGQTVDYDDAYTQGVLKGYALFSLSPVMALLPAVALAYDQFNNGSSLYELRGGADLRLGF